MIRYSLKNLKKRICSANFALQSVEQVVQNFYYTVLTTRIIHRIQYGVLATVCVLHNV